MRSIRKGPYLYLLVLLLIPFAAAKGATKFRATLSGQSETPSIRTSAHGRAVFTLSKNGKRLHYQLYVADLRDLTMAHIHIGAAGKEGPIGVWLYPSKPAPKEKVGKFTGVLARGTITAAKLTGPLQDKTVMDLVKDIKSGNAYVNVHTKQHPGGELRGQIR